MIEPDMAVESTTPPGRVHCLKGYDDVYRQRRSCETIHGGDCSSAYQRISCYVTTATLMMKRRRPSWLLLAYKVPSEPTRTRVGIWRWIKSLGAVYLQSGVCVLPSTLEHGRQLKLLQHEILKAGGAADILDAVATDEKQQSAIVQRFQEDRQADYREFLGKCADYQKDLRRETAIRNFTFAEFQENDEDLRKLRGWLEKIAALDFYGTQAAQEARKRLGECEQLLEEFAGRVFEVDQRPKTSEMGMNRDRPGVGSGKNQPRRITTKKRRWAGLRVTARRQAPRGRER